MNQIPWVAYEDKSLYDSCEFYNASEDVYRGSCLSMRDVLICVRNQPIENASDKKDEDHYHNNEYHH